MRYSKKVRDYGASDICGCLHTRMKTPLTRNVQINGSVFCLLNGEGGVGGGVGRFFSFVVPV